MYRILYTFKILVMPDFFLYKITTQVIFIASFVANTALVKNYKGSEFYPALGWPTHPSLPQFIDVGRRHTTPGQKQRRVYYPQLWGEMLALLHSAVSCLLFALEGGIPLPSKAVLCTNILEKIVQNKRQSVPTCACKTCRNVRDYGKLSPNRLRMLEYLSTSILTKAWGG